MLQVRHLLLTLLLLAVVASAGCESGSYDIWIEYERAGISVSAWDADRDDCNEWYPRRLDGSSSDGGYERDTCRDVVDEIIVRLPDGSTDEWFTPDGELYFRDWSSLDPGAIAEIEVHGRFGTKSLTIAVPDPRPEVMATATIEPDQVSATCAAAPADLVCIHGSYITHGGWHCDPDVGQASIAAPQFDPAVYRVGVIRLWREISEPGLQSSQRQSLTIEFL
jgi:hypothetical protein